MASGGGGAVTHVSGVTAVATAQQLASTEDWRVRMLESAAVRSMLALATDAVDAQRKYDPDSTPDVLVLVEMQAKSAGCSITHDGAIYQEYYDRISRIVGDTIRSPEPGSEACVSAMVAMAPEPAKDALRKGGALLGPAGLPENVPYARAKESRLGAFEIYILTAFPLDGSLHVPRVAGLWSKLWTRRFPNGTKLLKECQALLLPVFRRRDADTVMRAALHTVPLDLMLLRDAMGKHGGDASPEVVQEAHTRLDECDVADANLKQKMTLVEQRTTERGVCRQQLAASIDELHNALEQLATEASKHTLVRAGAVIAAAELRLKEKMW